MGGERSLPSYLFPVVRARDGTGGARSGKAYDHGGLQDLTGAGAVLLPESKMPCHSAARSIGMGFLCNALNPKAPIYFVSLFTVVLSPDMPLYQIAIYGLWMMLIQLFWFSLVALLLSRPSVYRLFRRCIGSVADGFGVSYLIVVSFVTGDGDLLPIRNGFLISEKMHSSFTPKVYVL